MLSFLPTSLPPSEREGDRGLNAVEGACVIKLLSKYHQECLTMVKYVLMSHPLHIYIYLKHLNSEKLIDPLGDELCFHFDGILLWNHGK